MKIKITLVLLVLQTISTKAQELTIKVNGGPSGILYESTQGNGNLKFGGGIGIGYTYFFNKHWGVGTGIDFSYNSNSFTLNEGTTFTSYEIDDQTSAFEYQVSPTNYSEKQHFFAATIPLLAQFKTQISSQTQFYIGAGGKFLIPGKQKSKVSASTLQLSGYYPDLNLTIDDVPSHGFGEVTAWKDETKTSLRSSFLLSAETGLAFKLNDKTHLYTGVYIDYGLSDMAKNSPNSNIVTYDPFGVDNTQANGTIGDKRIVQESRYFSAGIQVKLGFSLAKKPKQSVAEKTEVVTQLEEKTTVQTAAIEQKATPDVPVRTELTAVEKETIEKPLAFQEVGNTAVSPALTTQLDEIIKILESNKKAELTITGYTCDIGTEEQNLEIGMKRAQAVADYLIAKGISSNRLNLFTKGESDPLVPNTPEENKPLNRRVSLHIIE